ncbi:MAG TPA: acetyl-coenzyme A synthetase N-terminal domain-containing protein, partial [Chloroflexia bacterium]|nr:acetyl-coenzyme A synthetase N-terminal domain-containing protein [Chloroflexia bacterium]
MSDERPTSGLVGNSIPSGIVSPRAGDIAWRPSPVYLQRSRLRAFMERHGVPSFEQLLQQAAADPTWFWEAAVEDIGIEFYTPYTQVMDTSKGWEWATWFSGAQYNYVHDALDKRATGPDADRPAIIFEGEEGVIRTLTYA